MAGQSDDRTGGQRPAAAPQAAVQDQPGPAGRQPRTVRLPGFLIEEEIGLGDVIKRATSWAGIRPCGGCARRAEAVNRRVTLAPRAGRS
jgi:hypothetical protein